MNTGTTQPAKHVLFVTGPLREELFEHFTRLYESRYDVEVRLDRRFGERRREQRRPLEHERRSHERRRRRPDWIVPPPEGQ